MQSLKQDLKGALQQTSDETSDFDLNPGTHPKGRVLKDAAVLIAFCETKTGPQVLLTKRAAHLKAHPGQVAFPGGKKDDTDADLRATALREAEEEVGLPKDSVEILDKLPPHETVTGFRVTPYVAWVDHPWDQKFDPGEVSESFFVPAEHVLDPIRYHVESRVWMGAPRYFFTVPYGPYYIWGATARMLRALADRMAKDVHKG